MFQYFVIGHYRSDYLISWFDVENDHGSSSTFFFDLPHSGDDLYISVESYFMKTLPESCVTLNGRKQYPIVDLDVIINGYRVESSFYYDQGHDSILIEKAQAGSYEVKVDYDWQVNSISSRDYTVRTNYPEHIDIKDRYGRTNEKSMEYTREEEIGEEEEEEVVE